MEVLSECGIPGRAPPLEHVNDAPTALMLRESIRCYTVRWSVCWICAVRQPRTQEGSRWEPPAVFAWRDALGGALSFGLVAQRQERCGPQLVVWTRVPLMHQGVGGKGFGTQLLEYGASRVPSALMGPTQESSQRAVCSQLSSAV